jgi:hypothetical protein
MVTSYLSAARRVQELARSRGLRERNRPALTPLPGIHDAELAERLFYTQALMQLTDGGTNLIPSFSIHGSERIGAEQL